METPIVQPLHRSEGPHATTSEGGIRFHVQPCMVASGRGAPPPWCVRALGSHFGAVQGIRLRHTSGLARVSLTRLPLSHAYRSRAYRSHTLTAHTLTAHTLTDHAQPHTIMTRTSVKSGRGACGLSCLSWPLPIIGFDMFADRFRAKRCPAKTHSKLILQCSASRVRRLGFERNLCLEFRAF